MNPGLLDIPLNLLRLATAQDELGQPVETWESVGSFRGRKMKPKIWPEKPGGDRMNERTTFTYQVRSRPFVTLYQPGDRLQAQARTDFPVETWEIVGWGEIDGTSGMYVEVECGTVTRG